MEAKGRGKPFCTDMCVCCSTRISSALNPQRIARPTHAEEGGSLGVIALCTMKVDTLHFPLAKPRSREVRSPALWPEGRRRMTADGAFGSSLFTPRLVLIVHSEATSRHSPHRRPLFKGKGEGQYTTERVNGVCWARWSLPHPTYSSAVTAPL